MTAWLLCWSARPGLCCVMFAVELYSCVLPLLWCAFCSHGRLFLFACLFVCVSLVWYVCKGVDVFARLLVCFAFAGLPVCLFFCARLFDVLRCIRWLVVQMCICIVPVYEVRVCFATSRSCVIVLSVRLYLVCLHMFVSVRVGFACVFVSPCIVCVSCVCFVIVFVFVVLLACSFVLVCLRVCAGSLGLVCV